MKSGWVRTVYLVATMVLAATATNARAATINSLSTILPGASTGSVGPYGVTPAVNNDDEIGESQNVIPYSIFLNSPDILETEFVLGNSAGTTEYRFTQTFFNNTGTDWSGFRFELGYGTGSDFVLSQLADNLQFDAFEGHSTATSPAFTLTIDEMKILGWSGSVPRFRPAIFTFAIDVPDELSDSNPSGVNRFTLRQIPIEASAVPEPSSFALLGLGLFGAFAYRDSKRFSR